MPIPLTSPTSPPAEAEVVSVPRVLHTAPTHDELVELTADWTGPRFDSGRPRVPDEVLAGLRTATIEQAWGILREAGYHRQFAGGWQQTNPGRVLVGRAVTSQFLPHRPDLDAVVVATGAQEGNLEADRQNSWIIATLEPGDVMVTDIFGKVVDGTVIGDNLGTAVAARTGAGAVIDGGVRDATGLQELSEANFFHRGADPTAIQDVTLAGINRPIRIGPATVLPGDVVLGTTTGVIFVPAVLASAVAEASADIGVRDVFGKQRLVEGRYSSAQIDVPRWAEDIEADFQQWRGER